VKERRGAASKESQEPRLACRADFLILLTCPPPCMVTVMPSSFFTSVDLYRAGSNGALCLSTAALMAGRSASLVTGHANRKYAGMGGVQRGLCSFQCSFWPAGQGRRMGSLSSGWKGLSQSRACRQAVSTHMQRCSNRPPCTSSTSYQRQPCRMWRRYNRSAQFKHPRMAIS
jgi:hypothetical protein